jgi:tetratricopeptide (TPR) repeat protein
MTSSTRAFLFISLIALGMPMGSWAARKKPSKQPAENALEQAKDAWRHRDQPYQTESAIVLWERAVNEHPEKKELYISLTSAAGRAYRHAATDKEKEYWADEGREYGEKALQKNPNSPAAYAHYAEALGQWAQAHKGIGSLKIVKQAVGHLEHAIELEPHYAFAHMLLAQFYEKSPGMFSVGDKKKALEHAQLAVQYGPDYAINHLTLAKIYIARKRPTEAKAELETVLKLNPPADAIPETKADQETARELLKSL